VALGDNLIANDGIEWPDQVLEQQGAGIALSEWADQQLGQSTENVIADARPGGGDECYGLGEETASDEAEDLAGRLIQPVRVLHDAHERLFLGRLGEEGQRSDSNQETTRRRTFANPEHRRERVVLSWGEAIDEVEHRRTELMQPAVGELHLGLDADGIRDTESLGVRGQITEERGLARAWLTTEHDGSALTGANVGQELVEHLTLRLPPQESYGTVSPMQETPLWRNPILCLLRRVPAPRRY
jgi:hypothetical protein